MLLLGCQSTYTCIACRSDSGAPLHNRVSYRRPRASNTNNQVEHVSINTSPPSQTLGLRFSPSLLTPRNSKHQFSATMARSFDKDSRKGSQGTLPLSNAPTEAGSIRDMSPPVSLQSVDEPDWPRSWRAYACLLGCFALMFNSWGLVNAYGTWSSYYVGHSLMGTDQLKLNLIGSTQSFLVLLFSNPVGRLLDAGYARHVIGFGSFVVPLGLFLLSVVHPQNVHGMANFSSIWGVQGLLVGIGMAPFFVSSSQGKSQHHQKQVPILTLFSGCYILPQAKRSCCWLRRMRCQCSRCYLSYHAPLLDRGTRFCQCHSLRGRAHSVDLPLLVHLRLTKPSSCSARA